MAPFLDSLRKQGVVGGGAEGAAVSRSVDLGALARAAAAERQQQREGGEGCDGSGGSAAGRSRAPSHATGALGQDVGVDVLVCWCVMSSAVPYDSGHVGYNNTLPARCSR